jgi:hypothetical protein
VGAEGPGFNVTIYDYKYDGSIAGEWHVGSNDALQSKKFAQWFAAQR